MDGGTSGKWTGSEEKAYKIPLEHILTRQVGAIVHLGPDCMRPGYEL